MNVSDFGNVSGNIWVGDVFALKSPATSMKTCVFPAPAPIFSLSASIIHSNLFLPRSYTVVVETKGQIERTSYCRQALEKLFLGFSLIILLNGRWMLFQKEFRH